MLRVLDTGRIARQTAGLLVFACILSELTGFGQPLSLALGGVFMLADFHLIRLFVSRLIQGGVGRGRTVVLLTLKSLLLVLLLAGVFYQFPIAPLSFAFGVSLLLVAAVLEATLTGRSLAPAAARETDRQAIG